MNKVLQKIMNHEDIDEIYQTIKKSLFLQGPISSTTLEIITYLSMFVPDFFSGVSSEILSLMGVFYKQLDSSTLESKVLDLYGSYLKEKYNENYTPVQADILKKVHHSKTFSFSAPTSTGKSFVFRRLIKSSMSDVAIIVPSRALINEYYERISSMIEDKTINILTFVDIINTRNAVRNIFILTPERAKDLFKNKDNLQMELFLFDEAQLSNEESVRGLFFDSIVRRIQKAFPNSKMIFAHPFVDNPEAQLVKNNFSTDSSRAAKYEQKNVGQIFFAHDNSGFYHFGLDIKVMGRNKIMSDYDPILRAIRTGGSVLIYATKSSIYNKSVFDKFQLYIGMCQNLTDKTALKLIEQFKNSIGANDKGDGYYTSSMLENMKKGIIVHHGSLPLQARLILEQFTQNGFCKICFATSTLEQGINMPFDVVYLNTFQASKPLSMKNLIGRAGRSTTSSKFDYGSVVVKTENMSSFRRIMNQKEELSVISLLDTSDENDGDYHDFKEAINNGEYSDEYNLTNTELLRLSEKGIQELVAKTIDSMFHKNQLIPLSQINEDKDCKLQLYEHFRELYKFYLGGRDLSVGEESVLNTAIRIILWKIHNKTFKSICWLRYAHVARIPERRQLAKKYKSADSNAEKDKIIAKRNNLNARFIRGYNDIPNRNLPNYSIYDQGTKAIDVDYDRIVFDTYDYLDKLIGFKLSDIYYAIFEKYYLNHGDTRASQLAKYFKYGTDNTEEIWMLRYGLTFEDIEVLKPYVVSISQEEIVFSDEIYQLSTTQRKSIERYLK